VVLLAVTFLEGIRLVSRRAPTQMFPSEFEVGLESTYFREGIQAGSANFKVEKFKNSTHSYQ